MTNLPNNSEDNSITNTDEEIITLEKVSHHGEHKHIRSVSASGKIRYSKKSKHIKKHKKHSSGSKHDHRHNSKHEHHSEHGSEHDNKHTHSSSKPKSKKKKIIKIVLISLISFILITVISAVTVFEVKKHNGKKELLNNGSKEVIIEAPKDTIIEDDGQVVYHKGSKYKYNEDLITIVFMGIDKSELGAESNGQAGQSDAIYILAYDTKKDDYCIIPVSRETMADVRLYSAEGAEMGLEKMQICLAYAYGDGKEKSCENTIASLSKLFFNIPFTNYISMNWDGIAPLNDAIGGVELKVIEDIKTQYTTLYEGDKVRLKGNDAWSYVKYRNTSILQSNALRLKRQKQYIKEYYSQVRKSVLKDFSVASELLDLSEEYTCSNLSQDQLLYIISEILPTVKNSNDINFINIEGKTKQGEEYAEFYPDDESLYETILKVFYTKEEIS
jgi:anionic cell wall polymer biosynthesis LytR-Cps2A-Psr (LCP) family protein